MGPECGEINGSGKLYDVSGHGRHGTLVVDTAGDLSRVVDRYGPCTEHDGTTGSHSAGWNLGTGVIPSSTDYPTGLWLAFHKYDSTLDSSNDYGIICAQQLSGQQYGNAGDDTHFGCNANANIRARAIVGTTEYTKQWNSGFINDEWHVYGMFIDAVQVYAIRSGQHDGGTGLGGNAGSPIRFPSVDYNYLQICRRADGGDGLAGRVGWVALFLPAPFSLEQVLQMTGEMARDPYGWMSPDTALVVLDAAPAQYSIVGAVTVTTTVAASAMLEGRAIDGAVTVTTTVAATTMAYNQNPSIAGDVTVTTTVAAPVMDYTLNAAITGDVTVTATPAATMLEGRVLAGQINVGTTTEAQAIPISDNFTENTDTDLEDHTPDVGGTWSKEAVPTATVIGANDWIEGASTSSASIYVNDELFPLDDYSVEGRIYLDGSNSRWPGVIARFKAADPTFNSYYALYWDNDQSRWELDSVVNGSSTPLGSYAGNSPLNAWVKVRLVCNGTSISAQIEDNGIMVTRIAVTDSDLVWGTPGVFLYSDTRIDDFRVISEPAGRWYNRNADITGAVTVTATPAATTMEYARHYEIAGAVTVTVTAAATALLEGRTIDGAVTVTATPAASVMDYTLNASIAGAVTVTATPAAAMVEGRTLVGAVTVTATPAAAMVEGRTLDGAVTVTTTVAASVMEYARHYEIAGAVTVSTTVSGTMLEGRTIAGAVTVTTTVAATAMVYNLNASIDGAVTVTATPAAAAMVEGRILAGAVTVTTTVAASVMEYTATGDYEIVGAVTVTVTPAASAMVEGRIFAGDVTVTITPAATMLEGRGIAGAVTVTATPAAAFAIGRTIAGAVTVTATPAATALLEGRVLAGAVTVTATPAATAMIMGRTFAGAVTVTVTPASVMLEGRGIAGDVTVSTTVAATAMEYTLNASITGDVTVTTTVAGTMLEGRGLIGTVTVTATPASGMAYNLAGEIVGDITVSTTVAAAVMAYNRHAAIVGDITVVSSVQGGMVIEQNAIIGDVTVYISVAALSMDYAQVEPTVVVDVISPLVLLTTQFQPLTVDMIEETVVLRMADPNELTVEIREEIITARTVPNTQAIVVELLEDTITASLESGLQLLVAVDGDRAPVEEPDMVQLARQINDQTHAGYIYIGEAQPGSTTDAAAWRIKRMYISEDSDGNEDASVEWADGDSNFDNVWDNHLSLSYS